MGAVHQAQVARGQHDDVRARLVVSRNVVPGGSLGLCRGFGFPHRRCGLGTQAHLPILGAALQDSAQGFAHRLLAILHRFGQQGVDLVPVLVDVRIAADHILFGGQLLDQILQAQPIALLERGPLGLPVVREDLIQVFFGRHSFSFDLDSYRWDS